MSKLDHSCDGVIEGNYKVIHVRTFIILCASCTLFLPTHAHSWDSTLDVYVCIILYVCKYACMDGWMDVRIYVWMYACIYVCMYIPLDSSRLSFSNVVIMHVAYTSLALFPPPLINTCS